MCARSNNPSLKRKFSTKGITLRREIMHTHLHVNNVFATKNSKNPSRGIACIQLFVTDKEFMHAVHMKRK